MTEQFIKKFNIQFKLGTVNYGPGLLRFYGLNIRQFDDFHCTIDGDEKLEALEPSPISRSRRREIDEQLNDIERSSFMSVKGSINWLRITASPLCAFYSCYILGKSLSTLLAHNLIRIKYPSDSGILRGNIKIGTNFCARFLLASLTQCTLSAML